MRLPVARDTRMSSHRCSSAGLAPVADSEPMNALELRVPPPVVMLLCALLMWLLAGAAPALGMHIPGSVVLGVLLATAGAVINVAGVVAFRKAGTTINPLDPQAASQVVASGIFGLTRNPMYLGMLLVLVGWAVYLSNPLALAGPAVFVLYINRFQIGPEERALTAKFGERYTAYRSRVRRWL